MITVEDLSKEIGGRVLFKDVNLAFNKGHRYGLTGPNGAGKSTFLNMLVGSEALTSGLVYLPKKIGFLKQRLEEFREWTVIDTVIMGNGRLWKALKERDELYEAEAMTDEVGIRLGELEEVIAEEDGYSAESEGEVLLTGMGLPLDLHRKKMKEVPTDRQFRALLCQALFGHPEALLLDEPTNHLDLNSIGWLETFLHEYQGVLIVISHDRHFLNAVCTDIADIDYETVILYPGNYDSMVTTKMAVRGRAEGDNKAKEKKIAQLQVFVAKFGAGTRASQVQSRVREIQRLQPMELKKSNIQRPYIRFPNPEKASGQVVIKCSKLSGGYEEGTEVIQRWSGEIHKGDKIAVIGNNGLGKTTLLRLFAKELVPFSGLMQWGHAVEVGYFPQAHDELVDKTSKISAFDYLKGKTGVTLDQEIRGALGKMLFGGDDAFKPVSALSGGETARLLLASLMLQAPNLLILDEPNNHLDLEAVAALAWGLEDYKGTAIVASHDRDLIQGFATKLIVLDEKGVSFFQGSLDEYLCTKMNSKVGF
jgi:ATPase subunit of ABC transporter with duplicated ATPase domains